MDINDTLVIWSDRFVLFAVLFYVLAMVAHAIDLAGRFQGRAEAAVDTVDRADTVDRVDAVDSVDTVDGEGGSVAVAAPPRPRGMAGPIAFGLTALGLAANVGVLAMRGVGVGRWPWGTMYEFVIAICAAAVAAFMVAMLRWRIRGLGVFVLVPVVLGIGVAVRYLYVDAGPVDPILNSYWVAIHVSAAILASGIFIVSAVAAALYLLKLRGVGIAERLPAAEDLERLMHRSIMLAFPIWTFAVAAGAVWAAQAWGRYWGWDPKEVWSFIAWIAYAAYLHAHATAGWRGKKAAIVALIAFGTLLFNLVGVNIFLPGLHSYSGLD